MKAFWQHQIAVARLKAYLTFFALAGAHVIGHATLRIWDSGGADDNWTTALNWVGDVAPVAGDDLLFPPGARTGPLNDFPAGTTFNSITFSGGNYALDGNSISLNAGILATNGSENRIWCPLVLNSNQTFKFNYGSGSFYLPSAINMNGRDLALDVDTFAVIQVQGVISGAGTLSRTGLGSLSLYASNTFTGPFQILGGTTTIYNSGALGNTNGNTTIAAGAYLNLANPLTVSEPLVLSGNLLSVAGGAKTWNGPIILGASTAVIQSSASSGFTINGLISGSAGFTQTGVSPLVLNANNTYSGPTTNNSEGVLRINGFQPQSPIALASGTLGGTGVVSTVTAISAFSKTVGPGNSPGILTASNVTLSGTSTFAVELNSANPGTGYDQLNVVGSVALNGAALAIPNASTFTGGESFIIINNDGTDAVTGTFSGFTNGANLTIAGSPFVISYAGGTGNDVVLTQVASPPPVLHIHRSSPTNTAVSWGTNFSNYVLEANTNQNTAIWITVTNLPTTMGTNHFVTNSILESPKYFRLRKP